MNNYNENDFYFFLSMFANVLQIADFKMNVTQLSNDDLMRHLLQQDNVLNDQTENYLKKIIEQNETIIKQNEEIKKLLKGTIQLLTTKEHGDAFPKCSPL